MNGIMGRLQPKDSNPELWLVCPSPVLASPMPCASGPFWPKEFRGRAGAWRLARTPVSVATVPGAADLGAFPVAIPGKEMARRLKGTRRKVAA